MKTSAVRQIDGENIVMNSKFVNVKYSLFLCLVMACAVTDQIHDDNSMVSEIIFMVNFTTLFLIVFLRRTFIGIPNQRNDTHNANVCASCRCSMSVDPQK
jgi:hypothetical protein